MHTAYYHFHLSLGHLSVKDLDFKDRYPNYIAVVSTANQALAGTQCHKEQRGEGSSQQWSVACTQQGGMQ